MKSTTLFTISSTSTLLLLLASTAATVDARNTIRGGSIHNSKQLLHERDNDGWFPHPHDANRRLRPVHNNGHDASFTVNEDNEEEEDPADDACLLLLRIVDSSVAVDASAQLEAASANVFSSDGDRTADSSEATKPSMVDEETWVCHFTPEYAQLHTFGKEMLELRGNVTTELLNGFHPRSGSSTMSVKNLFLQASLDSDSSQISSLGLYVPDAKAIKIQDLPETSERHYKRRKLIREENKKRRRRRQRQLQYGDNPQAPSSMGNLDVLVVQVEDSEGDVAAPVSQLVDDIFTDQLSLKTGYEKCSKNQLIINQATATGDSRLNQGILQVSVDVAANAQSDNYDDKNALEDAAVAAARSALGQPELWRDWDLVVVCQPHGGPPPEVGGAWLAYAYVYFHTSFYNGKWCSSVSALMHEIGHNMGLGHSNDMKLGGDPSLGLELDQNQVDPYADQSGMMGYSYDYDDVPNMCFNAAKNFQLGWYDRQKLSFAPADNKNTVQTYVLNGVEEYVTDGPTLNKLVTLRLAEFGDTWYEDQASQIYWGVTGEFGRDYYVGFNDAHGVNWQTLEGANQVLVFAKPWGGPNLYGESVKLAALDVTEEGTNTYVIRDFANESGFDVTITVLSIEGRDATIEIVSGERPPPVSPTESPTESLEDAIPDEEEDPTTIAPTECKDLKFKVKGFARNFCKKVGKKNLQDEWCIEGMEAKEGKLVLESCPVTCGLCVTPPPLVCDGGDPATTFVDNPSFRKNDKDEKTCGWVAEDKATRCVNAEDVGECPATCRQYRNCVTCVDDPNFQWKGNDVKDCQWLANHVDGPAKIEDVCVNGTYKGFNVGYHWCPVTCAPYGSGCSAV